MGEQKKNWNLST